MTPAARIEADVAIIGGGPAGIAAATRAAEAGARTVVLDESPRIGGQIWRHRDRATVPAAARAWMARLERSGAAVHVGTSVFDLRASGTGVEIDAEHAGRAVHVRATTLVLATGARERFLPFPGWTLPGVFGVGGAQALLKAGVSFAGKRVIVAGSGPLLLPVAASLTADGARVDLVAEQASLGNVLAFAGGLWRRPTALAQAAVYRAGFLRTPYRADTWVTEARGDGRLEEIVITTKGGSRVLPCDALCVGYGLVPNSELARHIGCAVAAGVVNVDSRQQTTRPGIFSAGEATGIGGVDLALVEGQLAGLCAAGRAGSSEDFTALQAGRARLNALATAMERAFAPRAELRSLARPDTIVCRCEDVTIGAIDSRWSARQAKLYTRAGMGPCQGRVCGAALQFMYGWEADSVRLPVGSAPLDIVTVAGRSTRSDRASG
jgi:NADPH-dependent 2,4-dienoyl-CoA reductase/sulfur reductase-like enzyme